MNDLEIITVKASYDTWWSVVDDLRQGATLLDEEVKRIAADIADPEKTDTGTVKGNAPYLAMFHETIATRRHRAEALSTLIEGVE